MKYGNRSSFWKKVVASPLTLIVSAVLLAVLAKANWNIYTKASLSNTKLNQAQIELARQQARETELSGKVSDLSTDQGIEAEIRTKYHAVKEGESVAVIIDENKTASVVDASMTVATTSVSWWGRMLRGLGL